MTTHAASQAPILVVDDDRLALVRCEAALRNAGYETLELCQDSRAAADVMRRVHPSLVLLDLTMPHISGEELLKEIAADYPDTAVIILTGADDIETAVRCMREGAFDFVVKPYEDQRLLSGVERALELRSLRDEYDALKARLLADRLEHPEAFAAIVTGNAKMKALFRYVEAVSTTNRPVLITGETGVGKELMARAVHSLSGRTGAFVAVNISGLDDALCSDMLFGHEKGAYTGADSAKPGLVEAAAGGTLFLDEIGDLSQTSQTKLLRLIQENEYYPLGAVKPRRSAARVVVATLRDLDADKESGAFRRDLYYRLQTHRVHIPPLRERREDLPLLVEHFLHVAAQDLSKKKPTAPRELIDLLSTFPFPGNVRELEALVFDAVAKHQGKVLSTRTFRDYIEKARANVALAVAGPSAPLSDASRFSDWAVLPTLKEADSLLIDEAMRRANNNQALAASLLGIAPSSLNKRLKRARN